MKLFIDENLRVGQIRSFDRKNHELFFTRQGKKDSEIWKICLKYRCPIITGDQDFVRFAVWEPESYGVLFIATMPTGFPPHSVLPHLFTHFADVKQEQLKNTVVGVRFTELGAVDLQSFPVGIDYYRKSGILLGDSLCLDQNSPAANPINNHRLKIIRGEKSDQLSPDNSNETKLNPIDSAAKEAAPAVGKAADTEIQRALRERGLLGLVKTIGEK